MPLVQSQDYGKRSAVSVRELLQFGEILLEITFCEGLAAAHWGQQLHLSRRGRPTDKLAGLSLSVTALEIHRLKKCALTITR